MRSWKAVVVGLIVIAGCGVAKPPRLEQGSTAAGEQLLYPLPDGYDVVARTTKDNRENVQLVPHGQAIEGCTDMVIAQVFRGGVEQETPEKFAEAMAARWKKACDSSYAEILDRGETNGYPYAFWWMVCTKNKRDGKSEHTYAKAIAGKDGFYVVQKAWRAAPTDAQINDWKENYFRSVQLCDSRDPQHPCPANATVFVAK